MKLPNFNCITLLITLLAVGAFCPNLHAGWGSLQGNNRSAPAHFSAPQSRPQVNRSPEIRQTQPVREPQPAVQAPEPRQEARTVVHEQPRVDVHEQPQAVARARAEQADRQRMDIAQDRRQSYYWSDYRRGMRIDRLPDGYRRIGAHGHFYFYFEGVFYDDESWGYVVIAPPVDAEIPELPPGAETVVVGDTIYYYAAGAFYVQQPDGGYVVVAPPTGVTVSLLPPDALSVIINGTVYYQADGTYYLPVMQSGVTAYLTIPQP